MTDAAATPAAAAAPRWVALVFLCLLVVPFDPHWIDFEQVRRALLLLLTGALAVTLPRLPRVHGERAFLAFVAFLGLAALVGYRSLQPWEALYRVAHFVALWFVLRLGAALRDALATPLAVLLAAHSLFSLLQRLGLADLGGYGTAAEPVGTLGNLNVAAEWTAVAAVAVLVLPTTRAWLRLLAIALAAAYLAVNGSRGGLIAGAAGLLVFVVKRRDLAAVAAGALCAAAAGAGLLLQLALPVDGSEQLAQQRRGAETIEVRLEIARASGELFAERPWFGFGPGQFQVQYPRVRRPAEIELSTHGRAHAYEVRTAHDDWVELLVEGGLPLALLFAVALFALQRGARDKERLLPLFVLLLLMFARSPLGNAPAAVTALLPVAAALPGAGPPPRWRAWLLRALGLVLLLLGLLPLVAHTAFAPYLRARARGEVPDVRAVMRSYQWMWWEPRWLQLLAQEHLAQGNLAEARKAAAMAAKLRPHDPQLLLLVGETLAKGGDYAAAEAVAQEGLAIDPANPELRVLSSVSLMLQGRYDEAIEAVCKDPHPRLRERLVSHFRDLAATCERAGDATGAGRCRVEYLALEALDGLDDHSESGLIATNERLRALLLAATEADLQRRDLRPYLLNALHLLALGQPESAQNLGDTAKQRGLALTDWQRALIGEERLAPLLEHEVWFEVLRRRPRGG